jgi:hypothetical protein
MIGIIFFYLFSQRCSASMFSLVVKKIIQK